MKRTIVAVMLMAFSAALVGCEASAKVEDPDNDSVRSGTTYEKKTTTVREPDGDVKTKTEVKTDR